jgi:hypothetical protein
MSVINVTVTNAGAANVSVSNGSTVNATVGNGGAVNVAIGTISPGNATVVSGTLTINSTTTLAAGSSAFAKNVGTAFAASLDIGIPAGPATLVSVGNTTTLAAGSSATVNGTTSGSNLTLAFGIPAGANGTNGVTPRFAIGNVTTGAAGSSASVTATTTNSGANVTLDLTIPRGDPGTSGSNGTNGTSITLSDATPANLGTASAGSSNLAARADHIHGLPVIAYGNLSGVPANFPTNTTLVSGLNSSYSGINHGHNYVTALNNLTGSLTLAAGSNVTLTSNGSTLTIDSQAGLDGNTVIDGGDYAGEIIYSGTITITQQPSNQTAVNNAASFSVAANVSPAGNLAYQWQRSDNNGSTWLTVVGATASNVSLSGLTVASDNNDRYRVVVSSSGAASVTSNAATLTVPTNPDGDGTAASPWEIDSNFTSRTFTAPAAGTLYMQYSVFRSGSGSSPYGVQAVKSGGVTFIEVTGTINSFSGSVNSYSQQGRTLSAGESFFLETVGSVNITSISLWVA